VLIYRLSAVEEPQEVARYQLTREDSRQLSASFHSSKPTLYLPGEPQLRSLQLLGSRWELVRQDLISHGPRTILLTQSVKEHTLVTSSQQELCIWNTKTQEKLFEVEDFHLTATVVLAGSFFGTRNDGQLYCYTRAIKEEEAMEVEEVPSERIDFEQPEEEEEEEAESQRSRV
jgi:hypothetical protein